MCRPLAVRLAAVLLFCLGAGLVPSGPVAAAGRPAGSLVTPAVLWALGSTGEEVRNLEARLRQLGLLARISVDGIYTQPTASAVSRYQGRAVLPVTGSVDEVTWLNLTFDTRTPIRAELFPPKPGTALAALDPACLAGRVMCVDKSTRKLTWVVDGRIRRTLHVRFGSQFTPTRDGSFRVYRKSIDHVSSLYDTPMPYAMFFSGGQAVHYSPDFARVGYAGASHGCVNTRDRAAVAALFREVRIGDRVVVHR